MSIQTLVIVMLVLVTVGPTSLYAKKKNDTERAMVENMKAVPCGAKEHGVAGLGTLWASVGLTHVNSDEKLCPQYLLGTDEEDYDVRPTDLKHPVLLPVGQEAEIKIKGSRMFLRIPEGKDRKVRTYQVVAIRPTDTGTDGNESSAASADKP